MKNRMFLLVGMMLISCGMMAQKVSGTVTSSDEGTPLPGVSVVVKGTTNGTFTDAEGKYSVNAESSAILVFSFVGYTTEEMLVGNKTTIDLSLVPDIQSLQEVVVTALNIKKESKKLGYAVSTVKVDELVQNRTNNVMTSLEGKVAGLNIAPPSAGASSSNRIRLRGQASFNGFSNSPLIVINGLPMDQNARSAEGGGSPTDQGDALSQLNQDDIESITVLKGSTAAALYGNRAVNGAILINTKSGARDSGMGIEFSSNFSLDEIRDFTNYQTKYGTGIGGNRPTTRDQAVSMGNLSWGAKYDGEPTIQYDGVSRPYKADKNRFKEFYNTGSSLMNSIALSGGTPTSNFRVSYSKMNAKGISPGNTYSRDVFNVGINSNITKKLSLQTNINFAHEENKNPPMVGAQGIGFSSFLHRMPLTISIETLRKSVVNPDGSFMSTNPFDALLTNPYYLIGRRFDKTKRDRVLGTVSLRYDVFKWLFVQGRVNADVGYNSNEVNRPHGTGTTLRNSSDTGFTGTYNTTTSFNREMNMDFLIGSNHKIGEFTIEANIGGNAYTTNRRNTTQGVTDFIVKDVYSIPNGLTKTQNFGITRSQVNSIYAFGDIGYKSFLYLNLTTRTDFYSNLTPPSSIVKNPENYFNYSSVGVSFVFSELLSNLSWLDYGKLRTSYAITGNADGVPPYSTTLNYRMEDQSFGGYPIAVISNTSSPNPLLAPYKIAEKEIGLELRTFNSRLKFDVALYDKRTTNQIMPVLLSPASGYNEIRKNIGKLKNSGIELLVEGVPVTSGDFSWSVAANMAYNKSKVLALDKGQTRQVVVYFNGTGDEFLGTLAYDVGKDMNQLISRTYMRDANGNIMLDNSGKLIPSASLVNFGTANQNWTSGITNTFTYKKLSLLIHIDGKFGGKVFSSTALNGLRSGMSQASLKGRDGVIFDGVLPDGTKNNISVDPRIFYADYRSREISDPFVFSSDFIKLRNITLSYDLTSVVVKKVKFIKGLSLSAFCRNAAVLLKRIPDVDPEAFASTSDSRLGYEQHTEPTTRTFGLNLNAKF